MGLAMAGKTLLQKIIESHLITGEPTAGSPIKIRIDQTLCQDATGTMAFLELEALGIDRVKTELSIQYVDHNTSQFWPENHNDHLYLRSITDATGVLFSRPGNGICHQVHLERFGKPGKTLLGSDSHTPTSGGMGMLAIGAGGLDVALAMAGIPFKMVVPRVVGVKLSGRLRPWVAAKDVILKLLSILTTKGNVGTAVEYFGAGVDTLSVPERATITNMGAELGVTSSLFPSDEATLAFLRAQGREQDWQPLGADPEAAYDRIVEIDLGELVPLAACPSSPGDVRTVAAAGPVAVSQVILGSCTNSSLKDMRMAAEVLRGRLVHPDVSVAIAPGSRQVLEMLIRDGHLADLVSAGCRIVESACGPCIGQGLSPADGAVTVRTFNRNFPGRTGTNGDRCYLVSPETAVATALTGRLTDPRELGIEYPVWHMPERFLVDDRMILAPSPPDTPVEVIRKDTIGDPPSCTPLPATIEGTVLIRVGDKITTDHIMPAGRHLKLRSNIPAYAHVVFECFNEDGRETFAQRALRLKHEGRQGIVVAGESYGQGSSREHAAICPMYLGVRVVLARSIERIHAANLVNFGILPLLFADSTDAVPPGVGERIRIEDLAAQLRSGKTIVARCGRHDGTCETLSLAHELTLEDVETVLKGGVLA